MEKTSNNWPAIIYGILLMLMTGSYQWVLYSQRKSFEQRANRRWQMIIDQTDTINALNRELEEQQCYFVENEALNQEMVQLLTKTIKDRDKIIESYEKAVRDCSRSLRQCVELKRIPDR
jgi:uncharacterized protein (DUF1697 family)